MRMKFRCKNCGKIIFLHERLTQKVVDYMVARQEMWKSLWNKDFDGNRSVSLLGTVEENVKCCLAPNLEMMAFHGFE